MQHIQQHHAHCHVCHLGEEWQEGVGAVGEWGITECCRRQLMRLLLLLLLLLVVVVAAAGGG
jgi:hypothetical protein